MIHKIISFIKKELRHVKYEKLSALRLQLQDTIQSYENIYDVKKNDVVFEMIEDKKKTLARVDFELDMMRQMKT